MTTEELQACRDRAEAATPGPWEMSRRDDVMGGFDYFVEAGPLCVAVAAEDARPTRGMGAKRDAAFIAHARTDVPRLLATVDHAEARAERAEAALAELRRRVVANAGRARKHRTRWAHVGDATGYGRTEARNLCTSAGVDPDERIGCQCQWEAGDSPCHVHGENEEP
jgi:hypothetical protein